MDYWSVLFEILVLLGAAFVFGALAERLRQNAIVGYLLAGTLLGPILFNADAVFKVAELGVALLLFSIGLEFSFSRLKSLGALAIGGGTLQVISTIFAFAALASAWLPLGQAIALGSMVALSSTAVVLRVLMDRTEMESVSGRNALGILLLQDISVVPLVLLVTLLSQGGTTTQVAWTVIRTIAAAGFLIGAFYFLFHYFIPRIVLTRGLFRNRDLMVLLAIVVALGSSWSAHALGLSSALGAFLAGMILAESPFATQFRADVGALRTLFVTLFFTSIGMLAIPAWIFSHLPLILVCVSVVFLGKTIILFFIVRIFKGSAQASLATGITLAQVGEFSFVLAAIALENQLVGEDVFDLVVSVTIFTLFLAPYMVKLARPLSKRIVALVTRRSKAKPPGDDENEPRQVSPVVIIGFGPAGRKVAEALGLIGIKPVVIEQNNDSAKIAKANGLVVHLGDARQYEILSHAHIEFARYVVITVPDPRSAGRIIQNVRDIAPEAFILARARYQMLQWELVEAGADIIVDEENQVGRAISEELLAVLGERSDKPD